MKRLILEMLAAVVFAAVLSVLVASCSDAFAQALRRDDYGSASANAFQTCVVDQGDGGYNIVASGSISSLDGGFSYQLSAMVVPQTDAGLARAAAIDDMGDRMLRIASNTGDGGSF